MTTEAPLSYKSTHSDQKAAYSGKDTSISKSKRRSFFFTALPFYILAQFAHHLLTALPLPTVPDSCRLADRIGPTTLIMVGILGVALAGVLLGISQTYVTLLAFIILLGLLAGGYHPAANIYLYFGVQPYWTEEGILGKK